MKKQPYSGIAFDTYATLWNTLVGGLVIIKKIPDGWKKEPPYKETQIDWEAGNRLACVPLAAYETIAQPVYWMSRGAGKLLGKSRQKTERPTSNIPIFGGRARMEEERRMHEPMSDGTFFRKD